MSKIEKITPQIAALYLGQKCDAEWLLPFHAPWENIEIDNYVIGKLSDCLIEVKPHLRRLDSITEEEAKEIYRLSQGKEWPGKTDFLAWLVFEFEFMTKEACLSAFIGTPAVWLYLLGKGFDLLSLIDSGLATEIK